MSAFCRHSPMSCSRALHPFPFISFIGLDLMALISYLCDDICTIWERNICKYLGTYKSSRIKRGQTFKEVCVPILKNSFHIFDEKKPQNQSANLPSLKNVKKRYPSGMKMIWLRNKMITICVYLFVAPQISVCVS